MARVDDESAVFETRDPDAAPTAAVERWSQLPNARWLPVCPRDRGERREGGLRPAPDADVSRESIDHVDRDAVDAEQFAAPFGVRSDERIGTVDPDCGLGFQGDSRRLERHTDATVQPLVGQREVLKPHV